jgi:hypothetical protein
MVVWLRYAIKLFITKFFPFWSLKKVEPGYILRAVSIKKAVSHRETAWSASDKCYYIRFPTLELSRSGSEGVISGVAPPLVQPQFL